MAGPCQEGAHRARLRGDVFSFPRPACFVTGSFRITCAYPNADAEWPWQYVFPSANLSVDPRSGIRRRHHAHESAIGRAVTQAARRAGLTKRVTCHTFGHSFAAATFVLCEPCASAREAWDRPRILSQGQSTRRWREVELAVLERRRWPARRWRGTEPARHWERWGTRGEFGVI